MCNKVKDRIPSDPCFCPSRWLSKNTPKSAGDSQFAAVMACVVLQGAGVCCWFMELV